MNKLPMGVVGISTLLALVFTNCLDAKSALTYFANNNVIMMASMFVVSAGLSRTSLIDKFSHFIMRLTGGSFKRTYACYFAYSVRTAHPFRRNGAPFRFKLSKAQQVD